VGYLKTTIEKKTKALKDIIFASLHIFLPMWRNFHRHLLSQAHICPQGWKRTAAFLSEHTTHSSIYNREGKESEPLQRNNSHLATLISKCVSSVRKLSRCREIPYTFPPGCSFSYIYVPYLNRFYFCTQSPYVS
jgi:hypothetical protein